MNIKKAFIMIGTLLVSIPALHAGAVRTWKPMELFERAEVVIIGRPTKVMATGEKGTIQFGNRKEGREIPIAFFTAKVHVVAVIKGEDIEKEITVKYSRVDYTRIPGPVHVQRIGLGEDVLYLLYLNPTSGDDYVGALDSEFHQRQAAKALALISTEQDGADQPATAPESKSEGNSNPEPESEARSR